MARSGPSARDGANTGVFHQFSRCFSGSGWRPYYVRWERHATLRFDRQWRVRAEVEVNNAGRAFGRVFFTLPSGRASPFDEHGFDEFRADLERYGYELRHDPRLPLLLFLKRFSSKGPVLASERRELEARLWRGDRTPSRRGASLGGIAGAMHQFAGALAWAPSSCGWSRRFRLEDGVGVILAILLMQNAKGHGHHPEACVLLEPLESTDRRRLRKLATIIHATGYHGRVDRVHSAGRKPFLFGRFCKARLGTDGAAGERTRLDELAGVICQLR